MPVNLTTWFCLIIIILGLIIGLIIGDMVYIRSEITVSFFKSFVVKDNNKFSKVLGY